MTRLPVVAAIPNYNMAKQLEELLPTLMTAGYDGIYVLDDNSTDGSREITQGVSTDIRFVSNGENKGAGANRNRILRVLGHEATVHISSTQILAWTQSMRLRLLLRPYQAMSLAL